MQSNVIKHWIIFEISTKTEKVFLSHYSRVRTALFHPPGKMWISGEPIFMLILILNLRVQTLM